jgi:ParB family chromosome partitioning protein
MGEQVLSSDEWYTPMEYIEAVRDLYGGIIDLDPASNEEAQKIVQATTYYTQDDDGLNHDWSGNIFLNPPFSQPLVQMFIQKAIETYDDSPSTQIVIIVNNATDTEWFHELLSNGPCCLTRGRIQFWRPGEHSTANRQGQAIFYLGANPTSFTRIFSTFGTVITLS